MKSLICKATTIFSIALLAACSNGGGSDGSTTSGTNSSSGNTAPVISEVNGKVIDGYVVGATVFLDLNGNGSHEPNEPSAITEEGGLFNLELTENERFCANHVPLTVEVPADAYDESLGEVTEAYTLVLPPFRMGLDEADNIAYVTPLTTLVWEVLHEYSVDEKGKRKTPNCNATNRVVSESMSEVPQEAWTAIDALVQAYNLPASVLFSDFIASGDTETQSIAENVVRGFKKAFQEMLELKEANTNQYNRISYRRQGVEDNEGIEYLTWTKSRYSHEADPRGMVAGEWRVYDYSETTVEAVDDENLEPYALISQVIRRTEGQVFGDFVVDLGTIDNGCMLTNTYNAENNTAGISIEINNKTLDEGCSNQSPQKTLEAAMTDANDNRSGIIATIIDPANSVYDMFNDLENFVTTNENLPDATTLYDRITSVFPATWDQAVPEQYDDLGVVLIYTDTYSQGTDRFIHSHITDKEGWREIRFTLHENGTSVKECKNPGDEIFSDC